MFFDGRRDKPLSVVTAGVDVLSLKHYFPQSTARNRRAGRESWSAQVWMRDAVYIFLISALTFISYNIYFKYI